MNYEKIINTAQARAENEYFTAAPATKSQADRLIKGLKSGLITYSDIEFEYVTGEMIADGRARKLPVLTLRAAEKALADTGF